MPQHNHPFRKVDTPLAPWQRKLHEVIFEADTPAGKLFDVALFVAIGFSILVVMLESVPAYQAKHGPWLERAEWALTILFTIEYVLRLACVGRPLKYALSFYGIVDLLAIVPTYISYLNPNLRSLTVVRSLRLLRVFRVLKLAQYLTEARLLVASLKRTGAKITVFFAFVLIVVLILGSVMYVVENYFVETHGEEPDHFTSLPKSVYWAIVTVTTVGYGDVVPKSPVGQAISAFAMILGYSIIVVPTGIASAEIMAATKGQISTQACPSCSGEGHDADAVYCKHCGMGL